MTVRQLRARIAKLDAEIGVQRELLKKLERDKSLAQRQLNSVLDPVARLPLEISSEIFLQCLAPFPMHGAHHVPTLLLSICHSWSKIALSTPALWATIHISFPCARSFKEILPIWLERARNQPLSLSLQSAGGIDEDVVALIGRHDRQLKHLELYEMWRRYGNEMFEGASLGNLSSLEVLTMRCDDNWSLSHRPALELLHQTPNLIEYAVYGPKMWVDGYYARPDLPKLRRLTFGQPGACPDDGGDLLRCLSLPRLEALKIKAFYWGLLYFLTESSPPLLELNVKIKSGVEDFPALAAKLPHLTRFEVWYPEYEEVENLFTVLTKPQSPSLLPSLHTLVVHLDRHIEHSESLWMALIRALTARRTHIQVFQLTIPNPLPASCMPAPDILAAIRELRTDGMRVSISATEEPWSLFD